MKTADTFDKKPTQLNPPLHATGNLTVKSRVASLKKLSGWEFFLPSSHCIKGADGYDA